MENNEQQNIQDQNNFLKTHKKSVFLFLAILILVESFWAFRYIQSASSTIKLPVIKLPLTENQGPKEKIGSLVLAPDKITAKENQKFDIAINIDTNGRKANGVDAVISYDPKVLTAVDMDNTVPGIQAENGTLFTSLIINSIDPVEGKINLTASRLSKEEQPIEGTGTLAKLSFIPKKTGATKILVIFDYQKTNTSNITEAGTSNNVLTTVSDADVKIEK